jgi:S1-C subfamily serine protease
MIPAKARTQHALALIAALFLLHLAGCTSSASAQSPADIFERVRTSVVTIRTASRGPTAVEKALAVTELGLGSGVLITEDGKVITAAHVVQTADEVEVVFFDGGVASAKVLSTDPRADVALIKLVDELPASAHPRPLGDSARARIGEEILVVGAPMGVTQTLTVGHISARRTFPKELHGLVQLELLQTDAAINTGNSGGPMFNQAGEVIGIVSRMLSKSGGSEGLGFAVTSNVARELLLELPPLWSGLSGVVIRGDLAKALNVPNGMDGLLVQRVARGSLAAEAGITGGSIPTTIYGQDVLLGGDIITEVEGIPVGAADADQRIRKHLTALSPGGQITVRLVRAGRVMEVTPRLPKGEP